MTKLLLGFVIVIVYSLSSCVYDNQEDLFPKEEECITIEMSYSIDILPILETHCLGCHSNESNTGGVDMEGYEAVKIYVDNEAFAKSINHSSGTSPMPKNAEKLDDCTIQKIEAWIAQGALDN